jgi:hypothetical protein
MSVKVQGSKLLECDAMLRGSYVWKAHDALCFTGQGFKNLGGAMFLSRVLDCWSWRHCGRLVCREPLDQHLGVASQMTWTLSSITVKTQNFQWVWRVLSAWLDSTYSGSWVLYIMLTDSQHFKLVQWYLSTKPHGSASQNVAVFRTMAGHCVASYFVYITC